MVPGLMRFLVTPIVAFFARMRFPVLFGVTLAAFVVDLLIPDLIPFADEIALGLIAALLAAWRKERSENPCEETSARSPRD